MRMTPSSFLPLLLVAAGCSSGAPSTVAPGEHVGSSAEALSGPQGDATDAGAATSPIDFLSNTRPQIQFPTYTAAERQLVADQAQILLRDLYVHRWEKIAYYGPQVDPVPAIEDIVARAATMSDADFQLAVEHIFSATRDLHTNFYLPAPYSCFESFIPLDFNEIHGNEIATHIVVADTWAGYDVYDPAIDQMQPGDRLVSYDGKSPEDAIEGLVIEGAGANYDGGRRRAMEAMSLRWQLLQPLPDTDSVNLVLRHTDGTEYSVNLPWITYDTCFVPPDSATGAAPKPPVRKPSPLGTTAEDVYQRKFHERAGLTARTAAALSLQPSTEPILYYGTVSEGANDYGYLYLSSFEPEVLDIPGTVAEMASILQGPLAKTTGLIIDIRENGGGDINLGEEMLQLFSPKQVETIGFRLKNSALNAFFMDTIATYDDPDDPFTALIDAARHTHDKYTGLAPLTDAVSANSVSQAYFGPVAVLTDSACFSTCDMFAAGMQDNALATIWGEDVHTGGGGANVLNYSDFSANLPPDQQGPFLALPGGQDMRVAWRDAVRSGLNQGQILEDYGVTADENGAETDGDVVNARAHQIAKIASSLSAQAGNYVSRVAFADGGLATLTVPVGTSLAMPATVAATNRVEYFLDGVSLGRQSIHGTSVTLTPPGIGAQAVGTHLLELRATNGGQPAWRAYRTVTIQ